MVLWCFTVGSDNLSVGANAMVAGDVTGMNRPVRLARSLAAQ